MEFTAFIGGEIVERSDLNEALGPFLSRLAGNFETGFNESIAVWHECRVVALIRDTHDGIHILRLHETGIASDASSP